MSTATAFKYIRAFPFCVGDESARGFPYIDNLTLAQVMQFGWNLETFTITTSGGATKGAATVSASGTITSNPVGSTLFDRGGGSGMWLPSTANNTAWGSWAGPKEPRDRVCHTATDDLIGFFQGNHSSAPSTNFFSVGFYVGTDLVNAGKYRIYYELNITVTATSGLDSVQVYFLDNNGGGGTAWHSGTFTIGALSFPWYSYYTTGATPSGAGTLSASSGDYSY